MKAAGKNFLEVHYDSPKDFSSFSKEQSGLPVGKQLACFSLAL
jgi:hypothetical protein